VSHLTVPLVDIVALTPRTRLLTLDLGSQRFPFAAGQAVMLAPEGQRDPKPYSIASSPERAASTRQLELLIAIDAAGSPDLQWAERGAQVDLEGPLGTFVLPEHIDAPRLLFVAGGTGIAPLRSMIDEVLLKDAAREVALLYSARRADEFAFIDEFRAYATAGRLRLHQTVTRDDSSWRGRRGRIGRSDFTAVLQQPSGTLCFVCGPPAMVEESLSTLDALGVPADAVHTEQWGK
jgi:NAD(P)H-flavin reductase